MADAPFNVGTTAGTVRVNWAAAYVGLPFRVIGFDGDGVHCWGLVCMVYERELSIALPRFHAINSKNLLQTARAVGDSINAGPWLPVIGPRADFDVVVMAATLSVDGRLHRAPSHIGIAVGPRLILHVEDGIDSVCVSADHPTIRHRIIGAYRYECSGHAEPQPVLQT